MAIKTLEAIKAWFRTGCFPSESQFSDAFDSFRHKSDPIEITQSFQNALDEKADGEAFQGHIIDHENPHAVTKAQIGLSSVDNTSDAGKPVSIDQKNALDQKADVTTVQDHISDITNPHEVTKSQVGLSAVDNTSDADKPVSTAQATALALKINNNRIGAASGVAPLDSDSLIPAVYLPSYMDDVLEFANLAAFPAVGESGKIYIALDTLLQYRWTGSIYSKITTGEVASVNGRKGVIVLTKSDAGLDQVDNTSDAAKPLSTAQNDYITAHPVNAGGENLESVMTRNATSTKAPTFGGAVSLSGGTPSPGGYGISAYNLPVDLTEDGVAGHAKVGAGLSIREYAGESIAQFGNNHWHYTGRWNQAKAGVMVRLDTRNADPSLTGGHVYPVYQIQTREAGSATYTVPVQIAPSPDGSFIIQRSGRAGFLFGLDVEGKPVKGVSAPVVVNAAYSVLATDDIIVCNSATNFTITLPASVSTNRRIIFKNIGVGVVSLVVSGGGLLDDVTNYKVYQYDAVHVIDNSGKYLIL
jgi:hypothetical protein